MVALNEMRVLVLAQLFPPDMGGASTRAYNIVKGLVSRGHKVLIVTAFPHYPHGIVPKKYHKKILYREILSPGDVDIIRTWVPSLPSQGFTRRLLLFISFMLSSLFGLFWVGPVDIIWAANPNFFSVFPAKIYSIVKRVPLVRNVDDLWPEAIFDLHYVKSNRVKGVLEFFSKFSYNLADALTPISNEYKKTLIQKYGLPSKKIRVIEVGVDTSCFRPLSNLEKEKPFQDKFVLMYSGVFGPNYDFEIILQAAKALEKDANILFVLRGFGEMKPWIQKQINKLNIKNVLVKSTYLELPELNMLMNFADAFLLAHKKYEAAEAGLPTKLFEYQACGKPIICASLGEPARYIRSTESGITIEPGNVNQMVEAIRFLNSNPVERRRLGKNGLDYVKHNLTFKRLGANIEKLFYEISRSINIK